MIVWKVVLRVLGVRESEFLYDDRSLIGLEKVCGKSLLYVRTDGGGGWKSWPIVVATIKGVLGKEGAASGILLSLDQ